MLSLSKSKYCTLWQCEKAAWLDKHKPEERCIDPSVQSRFQAGNEVGDLAMGLFGDFVEVTAFREDGRLDLPAMIRRTEEEMAKGAPVICEASFSYKGLYCAVDLLKKDGDGWAIYEVKSATHWNHEVYIVDVSYQKYVLERCGVKVTATHLVYINNQYVRRGELDLDQLFAVQDITAQVVEEQRNVEGRLLAAEPVLESDREPDMDLGEQCNYPYTCAFWPYCTRRLPKPSVFDLYRLPFGQKLRYYARGIVGYDQLRSEPGMKTNAMRLRQIEYALEDRGDYVEKENIQKFLDTLSFPLYFLDFETMMPVIPPFDGVSPYRQVPFQYSLHYIEREGGELMHREFLAVSGEDPRRAVAEALCRDIPRDVCVTAYNKRFECDRLKELADQFPDLADHLLNIRERMKDFLDPFQKGYYYNRAMGGSFSIKSVLPALFPDDPELDYHALDGVHNGSEAMELFPRIKDLPPEEREQARRDLLKYCELDTYAMVKVWEKLREAVR